MTTQESLEQKLDDFSPTERRAALQQLAALDLPAPEATDNHNLHFHSFFSYNAEGWSPSHLAWAAHRAGLYAAGLCDFDVLDGMEEFLAAGETLGLRTTANLETRAYLREYSQLEISSPGEPGVTYIMGAGFTSPPGPGTPQAEGLAAYREGARCRNLALVQRINSHLPRVAIDYTADVLPLTPLGGATERHIIRAYLNKSHQVLGTPEALTDFWSEVLGQTPVEIAAVLGRPALEDLMRAKLVKRGGVGYVQPSESTFPPVDDFIAWVASCRAIPMITWLDGTSGGEADGRALLECMQAKGAAALNIIPDRNWNYSDPEKQAVKVANLEAIVSAADDLKLPINIGTEMNKGGLPFVDDLAGPVLNRFKSSFLHGAQVMVGQSILARFTTLSYPECDWDVERKNHFFAAVGALSPLTRPVAEKLRAAGEVEALEIIERAAAEGNWDDSYHE